MCLRLFALAARAFPAVGFERANGTRMNFIKRTGEPLGLLIAVRDVKNRHRKALSDALDVREEHVAALNVNTRQRFVHEKHRFGAHQRASKCRTLAFAARERLRHALEQFADAKQIGKFVDRGRSFSPAESHWKKDVLAHAQVRKKPVRLKDIAETALRVAG